MTKKQKTFVANYTNPLSKTYGNATQSAILAGYKDSNAASEGCKLLKYPHISKEIQRIEQELIDKSTKSQAEMKSIAWENFRKAEKEGQKQFWWNEYCKIEGLYINKVETKDTTQRTEEQKEAEFEGMMEAYERFRIAKSN